MSDTAIRASKPSPAGPPPMVPERAPRGKPDPMIKALMAIASLRLTVVLFGLAIFLVFAGTLAQVDDGVWTVVKKYFRCAVAWIPLQIFVQFGQVFFNLPKEWQIPREYAFPFPGGWLIGGVMLVNLLAAHAVRFKFSWKRSGIIVLHAGLIVLMLGELIAGMFQQEGNMSIEEGETAQVVVDQRHSQLEITDSTNPRFDSVSAVPEDLLRRGEPIRDDRLPVDVQVIRYMRNSELVSLDKVAPEFKNPADQGLGKSAGAQEVPEVSGVSQSERLDIPSAYVAFKDKKTGKSLGTYLVSVFLDPQPLEVDGKTYMVALYFKRAYRPFTMRLLEFRFDRYVGTNKPKNFSSRIQLVDPETNEDREVLIRMNEPLWHRGETFYQGGYNEKTEKGTVLQVVRNPGWMLPYLSCAMVALGMLMHFGMHLVEFLRRRVTA